MGWKLGAGRLEQQPKVCTISDSQYQLILTTYRITNPLPLKKTQHTQGNTAITRHKGSQLLKLIETRYQVQPSDKELHTEHTTLYVCLLVFGETAPIGP